MDDLIKQIKDMITKAAKADNPDAALKYSQGALNASHALQVLGYVKKENK